tara:strand:+ start:145998 stop:146519 length:522 start_codon:yes stop_codon:yes gene_type:complete
MVLGLLFFSCGNNSVDDISGLWDYTEKSIHVFDTIGGRGDFDTMQITYIIKTDSGRFEHFYTWDEDTLLKIEPYKSIEILQIEFDDKTHGIGSFYELDTTQALKEEPRYTANFNTNFSLYQTEGKSYLIFDYGFSQYGRAFDTVPVKSVSNDILVFDGDTLKKVKYNQYLNKK